MTRMLLLCFFWAILRAVPVTAAGVVQDTILQETLVLLDARLASADPVHTERLFADVAERTSRSRQQIRHHLLSRLDAFRDLANTDPVSWQAILDLRVETMSQRQTNRLLDKLTVWSRRVLRSDSDYLAGTGIRWAANEAHVPEDEGSTFVRHLVAHGVIDTTTEWVPPALGLVVSGWTDPYEFSLEPLYAFFAAPEEAYVREAVRDVQRFIVPRVVRRLPKSRGVLYAVRDREVTTLIDPEAELRLTVLGLRFGGTNADLLPCMDLSARLTTISSGAVTWQTTIAYCTESHGSATTNELDAFYEEVADIIYQRVDGHFEAR
ncbi:MAG: hypothetical protein O2782_02645 [bacterium]|nr:hypothetical protein [bacterium]